MSSEIFNWSLEQIALMCNREEAYSIRSSCDGEVKCLEDYLSFPEEICQDECEKIAAKFEQKYPGFRIESTQDWVEWDDYNKAIIYNYHILEN